MKNADKFDQYLVFFVIVFLAGIDNSNYFQTRHEELSTDARNFWILFGFGVCLTMFLCGVAVYCCVVSRRFAWKEEEEEEEEEEERRKDAVAQVEAIGWIKIEENE